MSRMLVLFCSLLAYCLAEQTKPDLPHKVADQTWAQHQLDLMELFYHIHEPMHIKEFIEVASTYSIEKNIANYENVTAVKIYMSLHEQSLLPRGIPFSILERTHLFEAETFFYVLYSAKDYDTFFKTAVWARDRVNEGLFLYILSVAIVHRPDTQGIIVPPIYEIMPTLFNNAEIMNTIERINTHGTKFVDHYHHTYVKAANVIAIKSNYTLWPYIDSEERLIHYLTHDHGLNAFYYYRHLINPFWLGGEIVQLSKDRRGEWYLFLHKQILARYYMERLSNGLGEIPELSYAVPIEEGFNSGLVYQNGIPLPVRSDHFNLVCPDNVNHINRLDEYERRIRNAIDRGYVVNHLGEHITLRTPEAIDILGSVIEANVDSPNVHFYRDFISIWKHLLGNSQHHHHYIGDVKMVVPSVLENFQTALRDPAFYMIWKRVFHLVELYQEHLPLYKREELALPNVQIQSVDLDKLQTYFDYSYINVTNHMYMHEDEQQSMHHHTQVLVERPRLNHKVFQTRIGVKSDVAKTVVVRLFLAPKYDSTGVKIPLHENNMNFMLLDQFKYDLQQGDNNIVRDSSENIWTVEDWTPAHELRLKALSVLQGGGQVTLDMSQRIDALPKRLVLPKGRVGGMPFVLMVYISEYHAPKVPFGTGFDPALSLGLGSGARFMTDEPLGYPLNRRLYEWQVQGLTNLYLTDVLVYHKHTPDLDVAHME